MSYSTGQYFIVVPCICNGLEVEKFFACCLWVHAIGAISSTKMLQFYANEMTITQKNSHSENISINLLSIIFVVNIKMLFGLTAVRF